MSHQHHITRIDPPKESFFEFRWKVVHPNDVVDETISPVFYVADHQIRMKIYKPEKEDFIALDDQGGSPCKVTTHLCVSIFTTMRLRNVPAKEFKVTIRNDRGEKEKLCEPNDPTRPENTYWRGAFHPAASTVIVIDLSVGRKHWALDETSLDNGLTPTNALHAILFDHGLADLWTGGEFTDCVLVVGERRFRAHKVVLAGCSPVLREKLKHTDELVLAGPAIEHKIEGRPIDADDFQAFLSCIYTGRVADTKRRVLPLMQLADRFKVHGLRLACQSYLDECVQKAQKKTTTTTLGGLGMDEVGSMVEELYTDTVLPNIPEEVAKLCAAIREMQNK
ncbi:unnamed protein product [Trichogramma brassicae]|uniref:BTB domain-containing protein n=1 Tax=Trichogramma brassicae TaxID=86971 RepID=A0A6H5IFZ5_9HYME|nr:unnamed protein product [Trichogramma brassicae]